MQANPISAPDSSPSLRQGWLWLGLTVLLIYGQVVTHEFVNYDDTGYITENIHVTHGLTLEGAKSAFTETTVSMWHPLTILSHMLDWQLFGAWAGGHLAGNVILHALNAGLLFVLLRRLTGAGWPSFVVALLFAAHPLNVESVAWASQRKSTLSALFFLLTLLAWQRYVSKKSFSTYGQALLLYALGLMSKPMLVSLPGILLLLDYWPLDRLKWTGRDLLKRVVEKLPFVALALVVAAITLNRSEVSAKMGPLPAFTSERCLRAIANIPVYLRRMVFPTDLALLYPYRTHVSAVELTAAVTVLGLITVLAWRRRGPQLMGWLWFLAMIFPVSGIVSMGPHEQADRYFYLPGIGIFVMAVWWVPSRCWARPRREVIAAVAVAGMACAAVAGWQTEFWRNSLTVWNRAVALYPPSAVQQMNYGNALAGVGRDVEAARCFELVIAVDPNDPRAFINLAVLRNRHGEKAAAIDLLTRAVRLNPGHARAHGLLGSYLQDAGRLAEAREQLEAAIALDPNLGSAHLDLGVLLIQLGDLRGAEHCFEAATRVQPDNLAAWQDLTIARAQLAAARRASQ